MSMIRNNFIIQIAGLNIEINTISPRTCIFCRKYLSEGKPDFKVNITADDVKKEIEENHAENKSNKIFLETVAAYRKIVEAALDYNVIMMHGAAVAIENKCFLFSAPSGTGKTTHIKQWIDNVDDSFVVNGDKPLLRFIGNEVFACGTPWCGNEDLSSNDMIPLSAIVIMERSNKNSIEEISFAHAYLYLLQETFLPRDREKAKKTLALLKKLYGKMRFYKFLFNNFADDCFSISYKALVGNSR